MKRINLVWLGSLQAMIDSFRLLNVKADAQYCRIFSNKQSKLS